MVSERKSVRGCDNCVRKGARWYCGADDAFLCETCDSFVHSANPLARRHERVRLKSKEDEDAHPPSWPKKARTPRRQKRRSSAPMHLVPVQDEEEEESEEQLLCRVPVMEVDDNPIRSGRENVFPSETDVESLLQFDFDMEGLGMFDDEWCLRIKDENEEEEKDLDLGRETFEEEKEGLNKGLLKLDYDRVMSAWDHKKSPWMSGERPELSTTDWWTDCCLGTISYAYGETSMAVVRSGGRGGREARVSRYREKRRTRLFSKKIRYEVRKLNAEKRPRMKGRFVKRPTFAPSTAFPSLN